MDIEYVACDWPSWEAMDEEERDVALADLELSRDAWMNGEEVMAVLKSALTTRGYSLAKIDGTYVLARLGARTLLAVGPDEMTDAMVAHLTSTREDDGRVLTVATTDLIEVADTLDTYLLDAASQAQATVEAWLAKAFHEGREMGGPHHG